MFIAMQKLFYGKKEFCFESMIKTWNCTKVFIYLFITVLMIKTWNCTKVFIYLFIAVYILMFQCKDDLYGSPVEASDT